MFLAWSLKKDPGKDCEKALSWALLWSFLSFPTLVVFLAVLSFIYRLLILFLSIGRC